MALGVGYDPRMGQSFESSAEGNVALKNFQQDQTTPTIIIKANQVVVTSTLDSAVAIDETSCDVVDATGMVVGQLLILTSTVSDRFYYGRILTIATNTLGLDTPFDYAFEAGQEAAATITDMSVDGSSTPEIFSLRAAEPVAGINLVVDITRILLTCETATAVDLSKFGDLAALTKGLVMRRVDGTFQNIFNVKTNNEIAGLVYDWTPFAATNPQQGQDGFVARLTAAGANKIGVTWRVGVLEDLQFIVQDNLLGITKLEITFEGHVVQ